MNHILCLGFNTLKYRKDPFVRISINDRFLDEFEVDAGQVGGEEDHKGWDKDRLIFNKKYFEIKRRDYRGRETEWTKDSYKDAINDKIKLKFYELPYSVLRNKVNLQIDVKNEDNNYTNGFMTKSTYLYFSVCLLLPKVYFRDLHKFANDLKRDYTFDRHNKKYYENALRIKKYYKRRLLICYNQTENVKWTDSNKKVTQGEIGWIGGNGTYNVELFKKHGLWTSYNPVPLGYPKLGEWELAKALSDKYLKYENKRSDNA